MSAGSNSDFMEVKIRVFVSCRFLRSLLRLSAYYHFDFDSFLDFLGHN